MLTDREKTLELAFNVQSLFRYGAHELSFDRFVFAKYAIKRHPAPEDKIEIIKIPGFTAA